MRVNGAMFERLPFPTVAEQFGRRRPALTAGEPPMRKRATDSRKSALRLENTAFNALFYHVGRMLADLFLHGSIVAKGSTLSLSLRFSEMIRHVNQLDLSGSRSSPSPTLIPAHHGTNTNIPFSMPVSVLARLAVMEQGVAANCDPVAADRQAGAAAPRQPARIAHQWSEEDTRALLARTQNDEGAYANAAD
jgi:hypothetical protein